MSDKEQPSYCTPSGPASATVVEKKSEFIAQLSPAATEEEALAFLAGVRAAHRTANHNVYAYLLRQNARARYSDDGEPAKTAGLPVLSCLQHAQLTDVVLVVTRYFGGTLLGTGGLVRAYTAAAQAAIAAAPIAVVRAVTTFSLTLPYPLYQQAQRLLDEAGSRPVGEPAFGENVCLAARLPAEDAPLLATKLNALLRGGPGLSVSEPDYQCW